LKARAKLYINAEIFLESIRTVILPNLNELRSLGEFTGEDVVLLMDNDPSHVDRFHWFLKDKYLLSLIMSSLCSTSCD
jgi:pyruvate-formate lyase-activating enzyme